MRKLGWKLFANYCHTMASPSLHKWKRELMDDHLVTWSKDELEKRSRLEWER